VSFPKFLAWLLSLALSVGGIEAFAYYVIPTHKARDLVLLGLIGAVLLTPEVYRGITKMWRR
jgi:hypothetical protein